MDPHKTLILLDGMLLALGLFPLSDDQETLYVEESE